MSKEKWRVPKLRFPGFTEDWEQRKFSDITYLSGIKNKENKPYESYSISNEFGFIPQDEQFENGGTMKTADKSMYYIVSQNSFAYNPARINVGSIGYYDKPNNVIVSSLYEVFKTIDIVNDKFLWHWFKSNQFNRLIEKYQEGGVRLYFYYDKLCKGTIDLPTINEQNKISNLLDRLDLYITLHQRKLNNLKLKKKALLQKLFPKNGERYPELRFPGFTDAWEQRKLIYIFNDFIVPMRDKPKVFSGTTPWTRIEDIEGRYINTSLSGQFVSDETIKSMNLKVIPKGSLIVSASATFGVVAIVNNDLITNQTFIGLVPNKDFDIDFLYSLFEAPTTKGKLLKLSAGSTIFYIARESFENLVLSVPSKEEQIKISKVFKSIDDSITLHQRKLDHLQLQKKALLQQMFV